jgi:superoxide reductase
MIERNQVYKCEVCGNIIEVLHAGGGQLICCNQPMRLLEAGTTDAATEKHVPVIQRTSSGFEVTVGSVMHPMEEQHYIEWIDLLADGKVYRQFLEPGAAPTAVFELAAERVAAREYCNLHGLWRTEE